MTKTLILPLAALAATFLLTATAHAKPAAWPTTGDHRREVVTMWGTPKRVTCGDLRWLVRHHDLDVRSTPRRRGDASCGR